MFRWPSFHGFRWSVSITKLKSSLTNGVRSLAMTRMPTCAALFQPQACRSGELELSQGSKQRIERGAGRLNLATRTPLVFDTIRDRNSYL
jgi:hypothetical protein